MAKIKKVSEKAAKPKKVVEKSVPLSIADLKEKILLEAKKVSIRRDKSSLKLKDLEIILENL